MDGENGEIESIFGGNGKRVINGAAVKTIGFSGEGWQENNQPIILNTTSEANGISHQRKVCTNTTHNIQSNGKCNNFGQHHLLSSIITY